MEKLNGKDKEQVEEKKQEVINLKINSVIVFKEMVLVNIILDKQVQLVCEKNDSRVNKNQEIYFLHDFRLDINVG